MTPSVGFTEGKAMTSVSELVTKSIMVVTAHPQIQVHMSFPHTMVLGADLNIDPSNWHWVVHCLTIPLKILNTLQFSLRPYKWIHNAIGVVGAEGDLSSSPNALNVVDYNAGPPSESSFLYYHTNNEEKQRMFPTDPNIRCTNVTDSDSVVTTQRIRFHEDIVEWDGVCILAGLEVMFCDAVHLLAHNKGDSYVTILSISPCSPLQWWQYISTYTQHCSWDPTGGDIVQNIDNVQKGFLLNALTHSVLSKHVAFLKVHNAFIFPWSLIGVWWFW